MDSFSREHGSRPPEKTMQSPRVLLLSRDEGFGELLKNRLSEVHFQIGATCTTAEEAISYIEAGIRVRLPFHAIFTTEQNQLEGIKKLKDIPKILLNPDVTGLSQKDRRELGIAMILDFQSDLFPYQVKAFFGQINK